MMRGEKGSPLHLELQTVKYLIKLRGGIPIYPMPNPSKHYPCRLSSGYKCTPPHRVYLNSTLPPGYLEYTWTLPFHLDIYNMLEPYFSTRISRVYLNPTLQPGYLEYTWTLPFHLDIYNMLEPYPSTWMYRVYLNSTLQPRYLEYTWTRPPEYMEYTWTLTFHLDI